MMHVCILSVAVSKKTLDMRINKKGDRCMCMSIDRILQSSGFIAINDYYTALQDEQLTKQNQVIIEITKLFAGGDV